MLYLKYALEFSPTVLSSPMLWALELLFLLFTVAALRFRPNKQPSPARRFSSILWLLLAPVLIAAFAIWQTDALVSHFQGFHWQNTALLMGIIAELALAIWLVRRLRQKAFAVLLGAGALWFTLAAAFVALMAMNHVWP